MLAGCLILSYLLQLVACENFVLKTNGSVFVGKKLKTVFENKPFVAYWKIPYATPPLKALRFKAPVKLDNYFNSYNDLSEPWEQSCSSCLNEDCLFLSVFVPYPEDTPKHLLPVLVWFHEHSHFHGPDFFIDEDVIVVTVSYRTGIFGFLNTGDDFAQGNMGAKDVIMALKWIRDHIRIFYGDVNRVTVSGSGFAGNIVASLLLTPAADDLFARVIVQSGSALSATDFKNYEFEVANKLFGRLSGSIEKLNRNMLYELLSTASTQKLALISQLLFDSTEVRDNQRLINFFALTVETTKNDPFMSKSSIDVYNRKMANSNVEVMMGFMNLESMYKLAGIASQRKLLQYLNYNFQYVLPFEGQSEEFESKRYKKIRRKIMDFYFVNGTITERSLKRYSKYVSDQVIYPVVRQARLQARGACKNVYLYRFTLNGLLNVRWKDSVQNLSIPGATAGDEICYLFKCKSVHHVYNTLKGSPEIEFIRRIVRLWANFVKSGNPTPDPSDPVVGDLIWEPLKESKLQVLNLNQTISLVRAPEAKRIRFWDDLRRKFFEKNTHDEL